MTVDDTSPAKDPQAFALLVKAASVEELNELMRGSRRQTILEDIFTGMPAIFRADRAGALNAVIHWRIGDRPDGGVDTFELVIADGRCELSDRSERDPRLTWTISAGDFLKMVTGNANPRILFMRGKMKAKGDLGLTAKFPSLFDIPKI
jgi:putative sterol carrier protein